MKCMTCVQATKGGIRSVPSTLRHLRQNLAGDLDDSDDSDDDSDSWSESDD